MAQSYGAVRLMQLIKTNEAERCLFRILEISPSKVGVTSPDVGRTRSCGSEEIRWTQRDRMMTGGGQAAAAAASTCSDEPQAGCQCQWQ